MLGSRADAQAFEAFCGVAHTRSVHFEDVLPLPWSLWTMERKGGRDGEGE